MDYSQNKRLHGLLTKTGLKSQKASLVLGFTEGRSESSKDLSFSEAVQLIAYLEGQVGQPTTDDPADKMRKKIIYYARSMGWEIEGKADMQRIKNWCIASGYLHKGLNEYTYNELPKLVSQFETVYKSYLKAI